MQRTLLAVGAFSLSLACAKPSAAPQVPTAYGTDQDLAAVMRGDATFAASLYANVHTPGNMLLSPLSVRTALAMTYAGARGATAAEMAVTLALDPSAQRDDLGFARVLTELSEGGGAPAEGVNGQSAALRVANNLWGHRGRAFDPSFVHRLETDYAAPFAAFDFANEPERSRLAINAFIAARTEQKVRELLRTIDPRTRLLVTNAVYFNAKWAEPFAMSDTTDADFFASPTKTVRAKLMTAVHHGSYAKVGDAQVVELPYTSGRMSMVIVLPDPKDGLDAIERSMTGGSIAGWASALRPDDIHVTLPRFTMGTKASLKGSLAAMGMPSAFDGRKADFSGIDGTRDLAIDDVIHQTFIAVAEAGTEAAAATAVLVAPPPSAEWRPLVEFRADHPFLFLLKEARTGAIVFIGRVADPTE